MSRTPLTPPARRQPFGGPAVSITGGAANDPLGLPPPGTDPRRSPVFDAVPRIRRYSGHFSRINVPNTIGTLLPTAGIPGVYVFRRIRVPEEVEALEVAYVGASWALWPMNSGDPSTATHSAVDGVAVYTLGLAGSGLRVGHTSFPRCWIGIGVSLPLPERTWGQMIVPAPHVEDSSPCHESEDTDNPWLELIPFPKGALADGSESPPFVGDSNTRLGHIVLPNPCTIDIALIVRRSYLTIDATTQHYLTGAARVTVSLDTAVRGLQEWR